MNEIEKIAPENTAKVRKKRVFAEFVFYYICFMSSDYDKVATAITFIKENFREQPSLEMVAEQVHLSPFHFQKLFSDWAGVSPKKFLQYLTVEHAKNMLTEKRATLFDTAIATGLSGTGRLHDLFITIEGMTPAEFRNGGQTLLINYSFAQTPFGNVIVASTDKGICYLAFYDDQQDALDELHKHFPKAAFQQMADLHQAAALSFFDRSKEWDSHLKLHLKGTPFQLKVWQALLNIPMGALRTYSQIANAIDHVKASRAVGSAVGDNPVAFLIPCHRVIRSTGEFGHYHWGAVRKSAMIGWEGSVTLSSTSTSLF